MEVVTVFKSLYLQLKLSLWSFYVINQSLNLCDLYFFLDLKQYIVKYPGYVTSWLMFCHLIRLDFILAYKSKTNIFSERDNYLIIAWLCVGQYLWRKMTNTMIKVWILLKIYLSHWWSPAQWINLSIFGINFSLIGHLLSYNHGVHCCYVNNRWMFIVFLQTDNKQCHLMLWIFK